MVAGGEQHSQAHFPGARKQNDRERKALVPTVTQNHHVCLIYKDAERSNTVMDAFNT